MAGVTVQLVRVSIVDWLTGAVAVIAFVVLRRFQPNSVWFVLAGGLIGLAARGVGLT
jgi:chromate transport protein ChrA